MDKKKHAEDIFRAALAAADPYKAVNQYAAHVRSIIENGKFKRVLVVGMGKASGEMARSAYDALGSLIQTGIVVTKHGAAALSEGRTGPVRILEAGHPVPDEHGVLAAKEILKLLEGADKETLVVCLISGGGSALLAAPYEGISLAEKQEVTQALLRAGADITELNAVRKHISAVKGGRLAHLAYPATVISLIISDVIGDPLDVIASGPTSPDESTYEQAMHILDKYRITVSQSISSHLKQGIQGIAPETPKPGEAAFNKVENLIIAGNRTALASAKDKAAEIGYSPLILTDKLRGDVENAAQWLFEQTTGRKSKDINCLICGGETTVVVKGNGLGGRNMELALRFGLLIENRQNICMLSAGTDGTDGPTDAAGAVVDSASMAEARGRGLHPEDYLKNNDSYNFFKKAGGLLVTGPTGTNVMDIQVVLIGEDDPS